MLLPNASIGSSQTVSYDTVWLRETSVTPHLESWIRPRATVRLHALDADECISHRNVNFVRPLATVAANVDISSPCATLHPAPCAPVSMQENKTAPKSQQSNKVHYQHNNSNHVYQCTGSSMSSMRVELSGNGATLSIEVDTRASLSLISENTYRSTWWAKKSHYYNPILHGSLSFIELTYTLVQ